MKPSVGNTLFYTGQYLEKELGLTWESAIVFSDYTSALWLELRDGIRFTRQMLFLCFGEVVSERHHKWDDWLDWDYVEICPWVNISAIKIIQEDALVKSMSQDDIHEWVSNLDDVVLHLPHLHIEERRLAVVIEGRPHSHRSRKGSKRLRELVKAFSLHTKSRMPEPLCGPLGVDVEVFTTNKQSLPDADRLAIPIMDAFKGIIYEDDKQIESLHPRVFETEHLLVRLECRTEPMGLHSIERVPIGSLFPLAKGISDYYVVRINCL